MSSAVLRQVNTSSGWMLRRASITACRLVRHNHTIPTVFHASELTSPAKIREAHNTDALSPRHLDLPGPAKPGHFLFARPRVHFKEGDKAYALSALQAFCFHANQRCALPFFTVVGL